MPAGIEGRRDASILALAFAFSGSTFQRSLIQADLHSRTVLHRSGGSNNNVPPAPSERRLALRCLSSRREREIGVPLHPQR